MLLDSLRQYEFINAWELSNVFVYSENSDGSIEGLNYRYPNPGERELSSRSTRMFDANGNEIERLVEAYDMTSNSFSPTTLYRLTYDLDNNLLLDLRQLNDSLGEWRDFTKWEYAMYDDFHNYGLSAYSIYNDTTGWIVDIEYEFEHFYEGLFLDSTIQTSNGDLLTVSGYDYNADDFLQQKSTASYFSGQINQLVKWSYEYNDEKLRSSRIFEIASPPTSDYFPINLENYSYTSQGEIELNILKVYDQSVSDLVNRFKIEYFYPPSTAVENLEISTIDIQWNNSMINQAEIYINELDRSKVSLDAAINTMWQVSVDMDTKYKETSEGGLTINLPVINPNC